MAKSGLRKFSTQVTALVSGGDSWGKEVKKYIIEIMELTGDCKMQ